MAIMPAKPPRVNTMMIHPAWRPTTPLCRTRGSADPANVQDMLGNVAMVRRGDDDDRESQMRTFPG